MATITVPSFSFGAFYYPDIVTALTLYTRENAPELSDENEHEPAVQFQRMFALVGHSNNVLIDVVANESTLVTAQLPETVRNMLRTIDFEMAAAAPGSADLLFRLNRVLTVATEVVPALGQVATQRAESDVPVIFYEVIDAVIAEPGNLLGAVFSEEADGTFFDHTSSANTGAAFTPWPTLMEPGASIYFGHATTMFDRLDIEVPVTGGISVAVWEFFDGVTEDTIPTAVTNIGGGVLQFDLTVLLGTLNRAGAVVRLTLQATGAFQEVVSTWNGSTNIAQTNLLGQTTASENAEDYISGSEWREMLSVNDQTGNLGQDGILTFSLPQDLQRNWQSSEINGFAGFYVRMRIVEVTSGTQPSLAQCDIDQGRQYVVAPALQGRSVLGETLGSSNGDAGQTFTTANDRFIEASEVVYVDGIAWARVTNFLGSFSQDQHYTAKLGEDDRATIAFGDGNSGQIPPIGQANVVIDYRHNAEDDGNVGPGTLIVDKTGLTNVDSVTNPRQAAGWTEAQSASVSGLERAKIEGPASLRNISVALSTDDMEALVVGFQSSNGSRPFTRAKGIEEGFGPKTVKMVVVAAGGGQATAGQLAELNTYLNGDRSATPPVRKRIVANQICTPVNFTPRTFNFVALVEAPSSVTSQAIGNQLSSNFQPEASEDGGVTFVWDFGDEVALTRIIHEIHNTDSRIRDVQLTQPSGNTQLSEVELPVTGALSIVVVNSI